MRTPLAAANRPLATDPRTATGVDAEGINCDFCHKLWSIILDPTTGLPYPDMPGVMSYELRRPDGEHQLFLGPLDDVPGEDARSDLYRRSEYCAGCHLINTPRCARGLDSSGTTMKTTDSGP